MATCSGLPYRCKYYARIRHVADAPAANVSTCHPDPLALTWHNVANNVAQTGQFFRVRRLPMYYTAMPKWLTCFRSETLRPTGCEGCCMLVFSLLIPCMYSVVNRGMQQPLITLVEMITWLRSHKRFTRSFLNGFKLTSRQIDTGYHKTRDLVQV